MPAVTRPGPLKRLVRGVALRIRRDAASGHLFYPVEGKRVFLRFAEEALREKHRRWWFENVYFRLYLPSGGDCVVDIGAGLGIEAAMLASRAPDIRYVANEIQPWVYECLSLTFAGLPSGYEAFGLAIGDKPVRIAPTRAGIDASITAGGPVVVQNVDWVAFKALFDISRVDLLKMNVEGAELNLLDHIDLKDVERVLVAVHDFRAERGEGERFRTDAGVKAILEGAGFRLSLLPNDWIFAERPPVVATPPQP
jgi:FkbM family methyltransferase